MKYKKIAKIACCFGLIACIIASDSTISFATRTVSEIEAEQAALQDEIDAIDSDIYAVVSQIAEINAEIDTTAAEIEDTQAALVEATAAKESQYAAMKLRIKYMYETPQESVFEMLIQSGSITQFLNRMDYANSVYEYDRAKLDQFIATQAEIEELAAALEEEKASLESAKKELKTQEAALEVMVTEKRGEMDDLDAELKEAKEIAAREAALRAAREAAARAAAGGASGEVRTSGNYNVNGDLNPGYRTGTSGSSVVSYANQFVGNRYVWGGNSLTDGCDCSGFVQGILANFGIAYGSRMTSDSFRGVGQELYAARRYSMLPRSRGYLCRWRSYC